MPHEFEHTLGAWATEGAKSTPSDSLRITGFQGGMKPPASVFNWFWSEVAKAIEELQEVSGSISDTLPISSGGTGATTAVQALINLGAAASKDHSVKTYTSLEQIGVTAGNETIADIVNAMDDNSILMYQINDTHNSNTYPAYTRGNAYIVATKINSDHVDFMFCVGTETSRVWTGFCGNVFGWSGWHEILTTANYADLTTTKSETTVTLSASAWADDGNGGYKQTVSVAGIKEGTTAFVDCKLSGSRVTDAQIINDWQYITYADDSTPGQLDFYCFGEAPTFNVPITVVIIK